MQSLSTSGSPIPVTPAYARAPMIALSSRLADLALALSGFLVVVFAALRVRAPGVLGTEHDWLWWMMAGGALCAGFGLWRMERWLPEASPTVLPVRFPSVSSRLWGFLCLLAGLAVAGWVMQRLWPNIQDWQETPLPWAVALLLMGLGGWLLGGTGQPASDYGPGLLRQGSEGFPRWLEITLFVLILALALGVRLYKLGEIPSAIYVDETNASLDALYLLEGRQDSPFATGWYETPNGYIYYMAGLYKLFGANYWTLKAASLLPALLTVPAVFFLGRYLFGSLAGLAAMYLLAISRWHMTMSRWGWNEVMPPLFQTLGVYFLVRGLRERRAFSYALGGLITGLTIYTYLSSRLAIATIALFALYWVAVDYHGPWTSWKRHWRGLVIFGAATLVAMAPIGVTYITHPFTFLNRAAEINIFHEVEQEGSLRPLRQNIWRHVQLFYQMGDPTGRQNLPGEPQTDPVTGSLMAVGLAYGLLRLRDRRRGLLWMWLVIAMAGGYLSELHIDSPNSYRTMTAIVAVVLLAGDVLARLTRSFLHLLPLSPEAEAPRPPVTPGGLVLAGLIALPLVAYAGYWEIDTYFNRQATAPSVQASFNIMETRVGHEVVDALEKGEAVYLSHRFYNFSPLRFLVYGAVADKMEANPLDTPPFHLARPEVDLPVPATGSGALFLLDPYYQSVMDYFRIFYPNADIRMEQGPGGGNIYLRAWVPAADLDRLQGLNAEIRRGDGSTQTLTLPGFSLDGAGGDVTGVTWRGSLRLESSGSYELVVQGDGRLAVDGADWQGNGYLGRGLHSLQVEQNGSGPIGLTWRRPDGGVEDVPESALFNVSPPQQGLWATYYANESWSGPPLMEQITPFLLLAWPANEPTFHPFSATYSGLLRIETPGFYQFRVEADDGVRFTLDGAVLGEGLIPDRPNGVRAGLELAVGEHPIRIDYFQRGGGSALEFFWSPPGSGEVPVPPSALLPGR
ncbi:MAG: glycosyltransferase family 39 protein [Caldilineaceae bacterium]|nr:glycosyltransferase family 39 protein [Caldilineaceae bacterium]